MSPWVWVLVPLALLGLLAAGAVAFWRPWATTPSRPAPTAPSVSIAPTPLVPPASDKSVSDIVQPEAVAGYQKTGQLGGDERMYFYENLERTKALTVSIKADPDAAHTKDLRQAGITDIQTFDNFACGNLRDSYWCFADVRDGSITAVPSSGSAATPDDVVRFMRGLLAKI